MTYLFKGISDERWKSVLTFFQLRRKNPRAWASCNMDNINCHKINYEVKSIECLYLASHLQQKVYREFSFNEDLSVKIIKD